MMNALKKISKHLFLTACLVFILYPIVILGFNSLKSDAEIYNNPVGLPLLLEWGNYSKAFLEGKLYVSVVNSLFVTCVSVFLIVLLSSFAAFALSRRNLFLKKKILALFIVGIMFPYHVGLFQLYKFFADYDLVNSLWGLVLIYAAYGMPFSVFLMTRFFEAVPKEIEEAAIIDGCGNFRLYFNIILPLSRTIMATVIIINAMWVWNDMLYPMIFISEKSLKTLPTALLGFQGTYTSQYGVLFAAVVLISIPVIATYLMLQKQFIQGVTDGAVKG